MGYSRTPIGNIVRRINDSTGVTEGLEDATGGGLDDLFLAADVVAATQAAYDAGQLDVYAGSVLPTVNGVRAGSVTLNAGTGNTVQRARITLAPPTDTIGAQRLLVPTEETYPIELGQTITIPVPDGAGTALVAHALGISDSTTYPGGGYCIGDTETDLLDAQSNDVRLEWLSDEIAKVEVTLEVGVTTQRAFLVVLGWTR